MSSFAITTASGMPIERFQCETLQATRLKNPEMEKLNSDVAQVYIRTAGWFTLSCIAAQLFAVTEFSINMIQVITGPHALAAKTALLAIGIHLVAMTQWIPEENSQAKYFSRALLAIYEGLLLSLFAVINPAVFTSSAAFAIGTVAGLGVMTLKTEDQSAYEKLTFAALLAIAAAGLGSFSLLDKTLMISHRILLSEGLALLSAYLLLNPQRNQSETKLHPFG